MYKYKNILMGMVYMWTEIYSVLALSALFFPGLWDLPVTIKRNTTIINMVYYQVGDKSADWLLSVKSFTTI